MYETQAASDADSWDQHNTFFFSKQKPSYMYSTLYYRKNIPGNSWLTVACVHLAPVSQQTPKALPYKVMEDIHCFTGCFLHIMTPRSPPTPVKWNYTA